MVHYVGNAVLALLIIRLVAGSHGDVTNGEDQNDDLMRSSPTLHSYDKLRIQT
jgi:hypothetical protein